MGAQTERSYTYKCAVAVVPISTVGHAATNSMFHGDPLIEQYWARVFGELKNNPELAKANSPSFQTDKINTPLLLIHSDKDPRTNPQDSRNIARKLCEAQKQGAYVEYAGEGHSFKKEENIIDQKERILEFVTTHLEMEKVYSRNNIPGSTGKVTEFEKGPEGALDI